MGSHCASLDVWFPSLTRGYTSKGYWDVYSETESPSPWLPPLSAAKCPTVLKNTVLKTDVIYTRPFGLACKRRYSHMAQRIRQVHLLLSRVKRNG